MQNFCSLDPYNYACEYVLQKFCLAMLAWCMTCILIFFVEITILEPVLIRYLAFRTPALFEQMPYHDA